MKIEELSTVVEKDYKVIIYPASRQLVAKESKEIAEKLYDFLSSWAAHEKPLTSSFKIEKNQFVVIVVDEEAEATTGCSIDNLNDVFREFDQKFDLGFFDRMKASYIENGEVKTLKLSDFRKGIKEGSISQEIDVFDFSKSHYTDFVQTFLLPLKESWAGMLLK